MRRRALALLDADRLAEARRALDPLLGHGAAAAGVEDQLATLVALVRVQARAGEARRALDTAARCAAVLSAADAASPLAAYAAALAEAVGGDAERAVQAARVAVRGTRADGDLLFQTRALGVLGEACLLLGGAVGAAHAAETLERARELSADMELADPDQVRRLADLAEALTLLGEDARAAAVLAEGQAATSRWPARWGGGARAALERAEGLRLAAHGDTAAAVAALAGAVHRLRALPLPVELARTLVAWGSVERRARHRPAARAALAEAERLCRAQEAAPLLARVLAEQDRLGPGERRPPAGVDAWADATAPSAPGQGRQNPSPEAVLTASELRAAELAASGATNREVAAALFVSVKTVEGTLSRVYRKLGVRSRTDLARLVPPPPAAR